jgi:NAD(P)-dependent dehydrogenase (short-subunit alcohol dehydrogenase family)
MAPSMMKANPTVPRHTVAYRSATPTRTDATARLSAVSPQRVSSPDAGVRGERIRHHLLRPGGRRPHVGRPRGNGGVIINISSTATVVGSPGDHVHYAVTKGAVETLTVGLSKEVGREGIRVKAIRVGTTETEIHKNVGNPDQPTMLAKLSPLGRVAVPDDIGHAVVYLASEKAAFVTGAILTISGGI